MIAGIVHQDGKLFWFDDLAVIKPEDLPRNNHTANTVWYTTASVSMKALIGLMNESDEAFG